MSLIKEIVNNINNQDEREELTDRLNIIEHKIKFREKIPVWLPELDNTLSKSIVEIVEFVGGVVVEHAQEAKVIMIYQAGLEETALMKLALEKVNPQFEAAQLKQVYLLHHFPQSPLEWLEFIEDCAEIMHPGFFVFGMEGKSWMRFNLV